MKKLLVLLLATMLVLGLILAGCAAPTTTPTPTPTPTATPTPTPTPIPTSTPTPTTKPEPIVIDYVSFIVTSNFEFAGWKPLFIDKINEKAKGELIIRVRGGPEVIGQFDIAMALQKGVIDMATCGAAGMIENVVPGIQAITLRQLTVEEVRASGAGNYIQEVFNKAGVYWIGTQEPSYKPFFYTFMKKKVENPKDFVGLKLGSSPAFLPAFRGWGATPTVIAMQDYYSAVEKGIVDGISSSLGFYVSSQVYEVGKYAIDHPYYEAPQTLLFNLASWNRLPKHLQQLFIDTQLEVEKAWPDIEAKRRESDRQKGIDAGLQFIKFSPDVEKWYLDAAYESAWKDWMKISPEVVGKLKELLSKK